MRCRRRRSITCSSATWSAGSPRARSSRKVSLALLPILTEQRDRSAEEVTRRAARNGAADKGGDRCVVRIDRRNDRNRVLQGEHRDIADQRHPAARALDLAGGVI